MAISYNGLWKLLADKKMSKADLRKAANNIDWSMPRVVCVAGDFTKYDESAIKKMNRLMCLLCHLKKAFQEMLQTSATGAAVRLSSICKVVRILRRQSL